jgi:sporulation protein YlmC with PRC-barrel domain
VNPRRPVPETPGTDGSLDVGLRLLDHQIVATDGELLGNLDNAVLEDVNDELALTALLTGPPAFAPRIGGRPERWIRSIWKRLRPEGDPAPILVPMTHVVSIASAVTVDDIGQRLIADAAQLERWLRHYLIARIPGATGGPDRLAGEPIGPTQPSAAREAPRLPRGAHLVTDLLGARVRVGGGEDLGAVLDLNTSAPAVGRTVVGSLPVVSLVYGQRRLGAEMGYRTEPRQGPWIIAAPMRRWHRSDRLVSIADVDEIDWAEGVVVLSRAANARHG